MDPRNEKKISKWERKIKNSEKNNLCFVDEKKALAEAEKEAREDHFFLFCKSTR
jgi:hypothetical protein